MFSLHDALRYNVLFEVNSWRQLLQLLDNEGEDSYWLGNEKGNRSRFCDHDVSLGYPSASDGKKGLLTETEFALKIQIAQ